MRGDMRSKFMEFKDLCDIIDQKLGKGASDYISSIEVQAEPGDAVRIRLEIRLPVTALNDLHLSRTEVKKDGE